MTEYMKKKYLTPEFKIKTIGTSSPMLSASVTPDEKSTSWADAEEDTEGVEIQVKSASTYSAWEDDWSK
jgi:hypothetical protein